MNLVAAIAASSVVLALVSLSPVASHRRAGLHHYPGGWSTSGNGPKRHLRPAADPAPAFDEATVSQCGLWTNFKNDYYFEHDRMNPYFVGVHLTPSNRHTRPKSLGTKPRPDLMPQICLGVIVGKNSVLISQSCVDDVMSLTGIIANVEVVVSYYEPTRPRYKDFTQHNNHSIILEASLCKGKVSDDEGYDYARNFAIVKTNQPIVYSQINVPICLSPCQSEVNKTNVGLNCDIRPPVTPLPTTTSTTSTTSTSTTTRPPLTTNGPMLAATLIGWDGDVCVPDFFQKHQCRRVFAQSVSGCRYRHEVYWKWKPVAAENPKSCEKVSCRIGGGNTFCLDDDLRDLKDFDNTELILCYNSESKEIPILPNDEWQRNDRWVLAGIGTPRGKKMVYSRIPSVTEEISEVIGSC